jgi:nucleoside triphosphate pyrophosphatase
VCPEFTVSPSDVEEQLEPGPLADAVTDLALRKARAVARRFPAAIVVGADTVVVIDGEPLGKPADAGEAGAMLRRLRGREHQVLTGVAVVDAATARHAGTTVSSRVFMANYGDADIAAYVASGEPFDKAGAYAIQGGGGALVDGLVGSYTNVIGLPVGATRRLLQAFGVAVTGTPMTRAPGGAAP